MSNGKKIIEGLEDAVAGRVVFTPPQDVKNPHDWVKSALGHGEKMCSRCSITNREADALGEAECPVQPPRDEPLGSEAYASQMQMAMMAVRNFNVIATVVDWDKIIRAMDRADAIGPILDPTLWMKGRDGLKSQRRIIVAAQAFKLAIDQQVADEAGARK